MRRQESKEQNCHYCIYPVNQSSQSQGFVSSCMWMYMDLLTGSGQHGGAVLEAVALQEEGFGF